MPGCTNIMTKARAKSPMSMHSDCRGDTDPRIFSHMPKQGHSGNFAPWLIAQELCVINASVIRREKTAIRRGHSPMIKRIPSAISTTGIM